MELDKRIKEGKRPLMCFDLKEAEQFVGEKGYFSDCLFKFQNLDDCSKSILHCVDDKCGDSNDYLFNDGKYYCRFFLPEAYVIPEEPKKNYRPFSLEEFLAIFSMGNRIDFKGKGCCDEVKVAMFTGYITDVDRIDDKTPGACEVMLGSFHYSLFSLFEDFELSYNGRWQPFGVIDEDKEQGNEFRR